MSSGYYLKQTQKVQLSNPKGNKNFVKSVTFMNQSLLDSLLGLIFEYGQQKLQRWMKCQQNHNTYYRVSNVLFHRLKPDYCKNTVSKFQFQK